MRNLTHTARWLLKLAWTTDRGRFLKAAVLLLVGYLATPAVALALSEFTDRLLADDLRVALILGGVIALALIAELMLGHFAHLYYFELGEEAEWRINSELIDHTNGTDGVEHLDSSEFADTMVLVRHEIQKMRVYIESLLQISALSAQLALTTAILGNLEPWLLLLPLGALPPVVMGRIAQRRVGRAQPAIPPSAARRHLVPIREGGSPLRLRRGAGAAARSELGHSVRAYQAWPAHRGGAPCPGPARLRPGLFHGPVRRAAPSGRRGHHHG
jgi:ATP-binding cassette subfamily B protein